MSVDRLNATEGQTVRLYLRNFVGNVLQNATSISVNIHPRGSSTIVASPTIQQESVGVYYIEWTIPSSNPESLKYDPSFPGSGYYSDIWVVDSVTVIQDLYVFPEGYQNSLSAVVDPIRLTHTLVTPRFEAGAKDFLIWRIEEVNGRLVPGETNYPDGELRILDGDRVVRNYTPMTRRADSNEYRLYVDASTFKAGIHQAQARFTIPESVLETRASVTGDTSLENGFAPVTDARLDLVIDGDNRSVLFPSTTTVARVEGVSTASTLNFKAAANDVFKVIVNDTEKVVRFVNTGSARNVTSIVDELNGISPIGGLTFPIVTTYRQHTSTDFTSLNTETLDFNVDGTDYHVQFSGFSLASTVGDVVSAINAVYPGTIAHDNSGVIALSDTAGVSEITVTGGTALDILGFVIGQGDTSDHNISPAVATDSGGAIQITASDSIRIESASEGSTANVSIGFPGGGLTVERTDAQPATVTASGASYPIQVVENTPAELSAVNEPSFPDYSVIGSGGTPTFMNGLTLELSELGTISGTTTITFSDTYLPPAITSVNPVGIHTFVEGSTDTFQINYDGNSVTVDFDANPAVSVGTSFSLSLSAVITQINAAISASAMAGNVIADTFQGSLRLRATSTGNGPLTLTRNSTYNGTLSALGFDGIPTSPTVFFQNDQMTDNGTLISADDYVEQFDTAKALQQINADATFSAQALASEVDGKITFTTILEGSTQKLEVSGGTAASILGFATPTGVVTGTDASNHSMVVTTASGGSETVSLSGKSGKSLTEIVNEINGQAVAFKAYDVNGQLELRTLNTGSTETIQVAEDTPSNGLVATLGLPTSLFTGSDAVDAIATSAVIGTVTFASGANAFLYIRAEDSTYTIVDLTSATSLTAVRDAINNSAIGSLGVTPQVVATVEGGNKLVLESLLTGSNARVEVGSVNTGSNANTTLGFSPEGAIGFGSDGQPYTLQQVIDRINAIYGGNEVAVENGNFLELNSISTGAASTVEILDTSTVNALSGLGLSVGVFVGTTETVLAQTIVSPKITLVFGG